MISNFDSFYTELISDTRWYELLRAYKDQTIRAAAEKVYAELVTLKVEKPLEDCRLHIYRICTKNGNGDKPQGKPWRVQEAEKKEAKAEAEKVLTYTKEYADKCAAEALEIIRNSKTLNYFPKVTHKQAVEEGDWIPKKDAPYPATKPEEAYVRDRHLAWIKDSFEPKTGMKLPGALDEETFNQIYDDQHLTDKGK